MEQVSTISAGTSRKASDLFPSYLVWLESFFLLCSAVLVFFAPPAVLNILVISGFVLLWLSISRAIAEYRNTGQISRQKWALKLVNWGYPILFWVSFVLNHYVDLPSLPDVAFWTCFVVLALPALMFRRIETSRFSEEKKQVLAQFQTAAKERYRGWVLIYVVGGLVMAGIWGALSAIVFYSA